MPWKTIQGDDGSVVGVAVGEDGKPLWVEGDKEVAYDHEETQRNLRSLNSESAGRRKEIDALRKRLQPIEGIENLDEFLEQAREAIELKQKIGDAQLIEAGKVDEVREATRKTFEGQMKDKDKALTKAQQEIEAIRNESRAFMIGKEFAASGWFAGDDSKSVLTPDIAQSYFGKNFKVENGSLVGYYDSGEQIYSETRAGEPATFDEAIEILINRHPHKDRLLRSANATGAGTESGNHKGKPASTWGHVKSKGQLKDPAGKMKFIREQGRDAYDKLPD